MKFLLVAAIIAVAPTQNPPLLDRIKPPLPVENMTPRPIVAQECCKRCSKGKPCGDSCISRKKQCRAGKGCAC